MSTTADPRTVLPERVRPDNGGPAFPVLRQHAWDREIVGTEGGMSLRDWFAGQALAGQAAAQGNKVKHLEPAQWLAERAYAIADFMMRARGE